MIVANRIVVRRVRRRVVVVVVRDARGVGGRVNVVALGGPVVLALFLFAVVITIIYFLS